VLADIPASKEHSPKGSRANCNRLLLFHCDIDDITAKWEKLGEQEKKGERQSKCWIVTGWFAPRAQMDGMKVSGSLSDVACSLS
jgi:hypothetical protein